MSNPRLRELDGSPKRQGVDESVVYAVDTASMGGSPTSIAVKVFDVTSTRTDVTTTVMPVNAPTVNGNIIQLSPLKSLTKDKWYRIEVKFTPANGNILEPYFMILAEE